MSFEISDTEGSSPLQLKVNDHVLNYVRALLMADIVSFIELMLYVTTYLFNVCNVSFNFEKCNKHIETKVNCPSSAPKFRCFHSVRLKNTKKKKLEGCLLFWANRCNALLNGLLGKFRFWYLL